MSTEADGDGGGISVWPMTLRKVTNEADTIKLYPDEKIVAFVGDALRESPFYFGMGVGSAVELAKNYVLNLATDTIADRKVAGYADKVAQNAQDQDKHVQYFTNLANIVLVLLSKAAGYIKTKPSRDGADPVATEIIRPMNNFKGVEEICDTINQIARQYDIPLCLSPLAAEAAVRGIIVLAHGAAAGGIVGEEFTQRVTKQKREDEFDLD